MREQKEKLRIAGAESVQYDLAQVARTKLDNQHLAWQQFRAKETHLSSRPFKFIIEMTQNCNFKCIMCPQSWEPQFKGYNPDLNMKMESFFEIANQVCPVATFVDLRGFGETTILPYWPEVVDYLQRFPLMEWHLVTNLSLTRDETWRKMIQMGFTLGFSCDGSTKEVFEKIRRNSKFDKIQHNMELISDEIERNKNGFLYYISTISNLNMHQLGDIVAMAHKYKVPEVQFKIVQGMPSLLEGMTPESMAPFVEEALYKALDFGVRINFNDWRFTKNVDSQLVRRADAITYQRAPHPITAFLEKKDLCLEPDIVNASKVSVNQNCFKPYSFMYINYKGLAGTCNHMMFPDMLEMGDFNKENLESIWNSSKYKEFRQDLVGATPKDGRCQWCFKHRMED